MTTEDFVGQFKFDKKLGGMVGIERECFTTDVGGMIKPLSATVLNGNVRSRLGYELSACQIEDRIGPCLIDRVQSELEANDRLLSELEIKHQFRRLYTEVAPDDMPLDVYPDPTGRYQVITANMPKHVLQAACQVAGTHIHVGMPDSETALAVYNNVITHLDELVRMGNLSDGRRMDIYKLMAPDFRSVPYTNWDELHKRAQDKGYEADPRSCWHLIRISVHGTIEFRMFGSTSCNQLVARWAEHCHQLCGI